MVIRSASSHTVDGVSGRVHGPKGPSGRGHGGCNHEGEKGVRAGGSPAAELGVAGHDCCAQCGDSSGFSLGAAGAIGVPIRDMLGDRLGDACGGDDVAAAAAVDNAPEDSLRQTLGEGLIGGGTGAPNAASIAEKTFRPGADEDDAVRGRSSARNPDVSRWRGKYPLRGELVREAAGDGGIESERTSRSSSCITTAAG